MNSKLKWLNKFNSWLFGLIPLAVILLISPGCASATPPPTPSPAKIVTLKVAGSGGVTSVIKALQPLFEQATPGYKLEILSGTSTAGGVKGVLDRVLDIALMSRAPKDDEAVVYVELGQAGHAIITHPAVTVTNLTAAHLKDIFLGQVKNWSEVG